MNRWEETTKKICTTLNYSEHCLISAYTVNGCITISAFV